MYGLKNLFLIVVLVLCFFMINGCSTNDDDNETKLTQQEANAALVENQETIQGVLNFVTQQAPAASNGDLQSLDVSSDNFFSFFKQTGGLQKPNTVTGEEEFTYDGQGCWVLNASESETDWLLSIDAAVCFVPYDELTGEPVDETTSMDFDLDIVGQVNIAEDGNIFDFGFVFGRELSVSGISDYNNGLGNLLLNGGEVNELDLSIVTSENSFSLEAIFNYSLLDIIFVPELEYPQGGAIEFSITWNQTPKHQDYPNFSITGKITFDGSGLAELTFAGFTYTIDVETGDILEIST